MFRKIIYLLLFIFTSSLFANKIPSSDDILRQIKTVQIQKNPNNLPKINIPKYKPKMGFDDKVEFFVKDFNITNNSIFSNEELLDIVKEYKNKKLTFSKLNEAVLLITKYYQEKGFILAKAYIPVQEIDKNSAVIEISIKEGYYGDFHISKSILVYSEFVKKVMNRAKDFNNGVVSTDTLERQMLILGDFGGISLVEAEVMAGKKPGTSDFKIPVIEDNKYFGTFTSDNYGSEMTGVYSLNLSFYINSLFGIGDTLGLSYVTSDIQNIKSESLTYSLPIGYDGLNFNTSLSHSFYTVGGGLEELNIHGISKGLTLGLTYPLIKTKKRKLDTSLTYSLKDSHDMDNYQEDRTKKVNSVALSISNSVQTSIFDKGGMSISSLTYTAGNIDVNEYAKSLDVLNSIGGYSKLGLSIMQIQALSDSFTLTCSLSGQLALDRNLDGGEDFSVGGSSGVKAYTSSELSGDNGYLTSLDLSYRLPAIFNINNSFSLVVDHAKVWDNKNVIDGISPTSRVLNDIAIVHSLSYDMMAIKSSFARGFGEDKEATGNGDNKSPEKFYIQLMVNF
jgi:hemolysin activation/secretion protein